MAENGRFSPGQTVVIREVWSGKVLRGGSYIVVRDDPEIMAFYAPADAVIRYPLTLDGGRVKPHQRLNGEWILTDLTSHRFTSLRLTVPGGGYSILIFWDDPGSILNHWYINLEEPMQRTKQGFDITDYFLDIRIKPDLSSWNWKDEDEFAEAIELGIITWEKAALIRAEGEKVANWIKSGRSPFNAWANWKPDPAWKTPVLPAGWDRV
jgi:predicted RNA-binding protein associated with RNAse of E/G family